MQLRISVRLSVLFALVLLGLPGIALASSRADTTQSPYFAITNGDPKLDHLPLKASTAKVDIAGVIARVGITQVYKNEGKRPIEAVYVFPASTHAAIFAMEMRIGKRVIKAQIETKKQAQALYTKAKKAGKTASLLQQDRPNLFKMKLANLMPGEQVSITLDYVEVVVPTAGIYEFSFPTVVGPRFTGEDTNPTNSLANPHSKAGVAPSYSWGIQASISAGAPITAVTSPSHQVKLLGSGTTQVSVNTIQSDGGNRDFVLRYRLAGDSIQTGLLLYPGDKENFFLATVQPPKRVKPKNITEREYIFIVDVSGSMHGFPLQTARSLMSKLLGSLRTSDRFNLMLFAGGNTVLSPQSQRANSSAIRQAKAMLDNRNYGGGTQILGALKQALAMKRNPNLSTTFVVITDGYVSVEKEAFSLIADNLGTANLFTFGIGSSVNRHLMEGMARAGMGEPFIALNDKEATKQAKHFVTMVSSPVLTQVRFQTKGFQVYDVQPTSIPDVFSERPVLIFGKYRGNASGTLTVSGQSAKGRFSKTINVASEGVRSKANEALRFLWARHKIQSLEHSAGKKEIEAAGLKYGLLTEFTSFVAIDSRVNNANGSSTTVRQVLPMPAGVPNSAVSGFSGLTGGAAGWGTVGSGSYGAIGHGSGTWGNGVGGAGYGRRRRSKASPPSVQIGKSVVTGSIDKAIIRRYIRRKLARIRFCYEKQLVMTPNLQGKIVVRFTIDTDGKVVKSTATGLGKTPVGACVAKAIETIHFPSSPGIVRITYPFHFKPAK